MTMPDPQILVRHLQHDPGAGRWLIRGIIEQHYLHCLPDARCSVESYVVYLDHGEHTPAAGALIFGRPESTRCGTWYGPLAGVRTGRYGVTNWQILNLARVWLDPDCQAGGENCLPAVVPGFTDRHGVFRSTLASAAIQAAIQVIGFEYLLHRPPVFLDEPYEIKWLLSYCDTRHHRGTIYRAAGAELHHTNGRGLQTWRWPLPPLTAEQHAQVHRASATDPRARRFRAQRAQLHLPSFTAYL